MNFIHCLDVIIDKLLWEWNEYFQLTFYRPVGVVMTWLWAEII